MNRGVKEDTLRMLCENVQWKAPLVAEPSRDLTSLNVSLDGDSGGVPAAGNACDEWHCPCGGSASCA